MKIGLDQYTIHHLPLDARGVLDFAQERGLEGVQFGSPLQLSPALDPGEIRAAREYAAARGLYLELGIPPINPHQATGDRRQAAGDRGDGLEQSPVACRLSPVAYAERLEELMRA